MQPVRADPGHVSEETDPHFEYDFDPRPTLSAVFRHSGWAPTRQRVAAAMRRINGGTWSLDAFCSCGDTIRVMRSLADPNVFKLTGTYCHNRFCVPCANERSRVIVHNLLNNLPKTTIRMITLTIAASTGNLADRIAHIRQSLRKLQRGAHWKRYVTGGIAFLEVKRSSRSESWHVHYHLLAEGHYWPHDVLRDAWHNVTGDSHIVDIRPARTRNGIASYAAKYAGKPLDPRAVRDPVLLEEALRALHGVHLIAAFGRWRRISLTKPIDTGEWEDVGGLDTYLTAAANGDPIAEALLRAVRGGDPYGAMQIAIDRTPPARPPPPERHRQLRFWPEAPICF